MVTYLFHQVWPGSLFAIGISFYLEVYYSSDKVHEALPSSRSLWASENSLTTSDVKTSRNPDFQTSVECRCAVPTIPLVLRLR
jgi:hypothetical protein